MKKNIFASIIVFISVNIFAHAQGTDLYEYISKTIMAGAHSVIMETTKKGISPDDIKITEKFGEAQNPFTGEKYFRNYVSYPYYAIRKVCSALDGEISEIGMRENQHASARRDLFFSPCEYFIIIKSEDLEIEYFGCMSIDKNLKVGDKIKKGTYLSTMLGGGDGGMVLNIRMKYKCEIIDPSAWFPSYF